MALQAVVGYGKIEQQKLICRGRLVLRLFDIDAANEIATVDQILRQMMTDKTTRARYQYSCRC